jgi:hypothetical protein
MALAPTQPITKMSTRSLSWGVKAAGVRADNLTMFMWRLPWNSGSLKFLQYQGPLQACNWVASDIVCNLHMVWLFRIITLKLMGMMSCSTETLNHAGWCFCGKAPRKWEKAAYVSITCS